MKDDDNDGRKLQWKCQMCLRLSLSFEHLNNCRTVVPLCRYWTAVLTLSFSLVALKRDLFCFAAVAAAAKELKNNVLLLAKVANLTELLSKLQCTDITFN